MVIMAIAIEGIVRTLQTFSGDSTFGGDAWLGFVAGNVSY